MELTQNIKTQIKNSISSFNQESCGLVVSSSNKYIVYPCQNLSENPNHHFKLCPLDYLRASLIGKIVACYHTHVGEIVSFSEYDKLQSTFHNLSYILYHIPSDSFYTFEPQDHL